MFAVSYTYSGGDSRQITAGIFYACLMICGFVPPCGASMRPLPLWCRTTGQAEPFFISDRIRINSSNMSKTTERICSGVKYSTLSTTDDARQAFLEKFPLVQKLKVSHRKYYYFAHAVYDGRKLFCHAYKSWEALIERFEAEYNLKCLDMMPE